MPCATVHLLTAGRALDSWRAQPARAPFDPGEPALVQDFLAGAMAPDAGFVIHQYLPFFYQSYLV